MTETIYVFSNCGYLDQLPKSGGQSSARRVMKGLEESGFKVVPIRRHRGEWEGRVAHMVETLLYVLIDSMKLFAKLLFGRRKNSVFLHLTYAGPLVPYELWLTVMVRMLGYRSMEYLKGGQVIDMFPKGGRLHKYLFKKNLDLQSVVFFEGMESLELASKITNTRLVYFPNYCQDQIIPDTNAQRGHDEINLIYFGRIAPNKNVHVVIDTFEILCKKYDRLNLTIIGGKGQSQSYMDQVDAMVLSSQHSSRINRMGNTPFEDIKRILKSQHFFVFPSHEKCEGHSNSLNEAMSQGVVPIVSDYHFNRTVVGDDRMVVDDYSAESYAERIDSIIRRGEIPELSDFVWNRIRDNYSYSVVTERIAKEIEIVNG